MEENTKNQIDSIAKEIESKFENVASTNKDEFNALTEKFNELNSRIDAQEVATKKFNESREPKSFRNTLTKAISEGAIDALKNGNARSAKFEIKADMTTGADFTGEVIPADRVAGYKFDPTRSTHVRQLIPTGSTASDVVRFVKESGYSNGAGATAEGSKRSENWNVLQNFRRNACGHTTIDKLSFSACA
jgi:HK97 family phage major capsid protein